MSFGTELTTAGILTEFTQAVHALGGRVSDSFDDGSRLFARSVLPDVKTVRPGDGFQRGVAIRATDEEVWLHPYLFRLVCTNGAVVAQTLTSRHIPQLHDHDADEAIEIIHDAVTACCANEVFLTTLNTVRTSMERDADVAFSLMPLLSRFPASASGRLLQQILGHFFRDGGRTRYHLMNAVTATARDTENPQVKWELEEIGWAMAIDSPISQRMAAAARRHETVAVG
jgi:hypothetical protein